MRCCIRFSWCLLVCLLAQALAGPSSGGEWLVSPSRVELSDGFARRQIQIERDGRDVTRNATFSVRDPNVARVDEFAGIVPVGDGSTQVTVSVDGESRSLDVVVSGVATGRTVDFGAEIVPLLSRHGCNSGGCHGKQGGQNGFQLSLFGFDREFDHDAIAKQDRGRRIFPAAPEQSLLLRKAAATVPHGGGQKLPPDSDGYRLLARWIAGGARPAQPDAATVTRLRVTPTDRTLGPDDGRQLAVLASYSDGTERDVTRQAEFASNLEPVATVSENGYVRAGTQRGEASIMVRFMGHVATFRAIVPHGPPLAEIAGFEPVNYVDRLAVDKWKKLGLVPSAVCDDATFLRRVTVDLAGRLPTVDEVRGFLADSSPEKRRTLVDRLLASPDYPAFFAMRWGTILRNSNLAGADQAAYAFHNWIKDLIARNRPYDELVRGVVAAAGEWQDAPAINWYWQSRDDQLHQVTADTAQVFLGLRLQCARCHHHPYERWSQDDYFGLAGFFTRLGRKSFGQPPPYFAAAAPTTSEKHPRTGKVPEPKFLDGDYAKLTPEDDPRHALVDWMTRPENPFFARVLVNRLWGHFFGRGLVHEVDDLRESNPPSNPELLDALARDFVEHKFDMKHIVRTLVTSRVYQLSSEPTDANRHDRQNFARFYARRLIAEVFLDAVDSACGVRTRFSGVGTSARAIDLPHEGFGSYFLDTFDRPRRVTGCECERSSSPTLAQVLLLANSEEIENKLAAGDGRIAKLVGEKKPPTEILDVLYVATLSRPPTEAELRTQLEFVVAQPDPRPALEDVLWTLLNSKEFMFNR